MLNLLILMGRLTDIPQIRYTTGGSTIASFTLAVPSYDGKNTFFFDIQCFGKTAEFAEKFLAKGLRVVVQGRLDAGTYEIKDNNGNASKKFFARMVANAIDFADAKPKQEKQEEPKKEEMITVPDGEELPFQ